MELEKVRLLKSEIIKNLNGIHQVKQLEPKFQNFFKDYRDSTQRMLAVGYAKKKAGNYSLELRVKSKNGKAAELACRIRDTLKDDVNIKILRNIKIPDSPAECEKLAKSQSNYNFTGYPPFCTKNKTLSIGLSIGHSNGGSGTLGAFFIDPDNQNKLILSCNHVLALCNTAEEGDPIFHPGSVDSSCTSDNIIGYLEKYYHLSTENAKQYDAAFAKLKSKIRIKGNVIPEGDFKGQYIHPPNTEAVVIGTEVEKFGRTTGHSRGAVKSASMDGIKIEMDNINDKTKTFSFNDIFEVYSIKVDEPFSKAGDSGSLVFYRNNSEFYAIGIVFAGAETAGFEGSEYKPISLCYTLKNVINDPNITYKWYEND